MRDSSPLLGARWIAATCLVLAACENPFGGDKGGGVVYWAVEVNGNPLPPNTLTTTIWVKALDNTSQVDSIGFRRFGIELLSDGSYVEHVAYVVENGEGDAFGERLGYARSGETVTITPPAFFRGFNGSGTLRGNRMELSGHYEHFRGTNFDGLEVITRVPVSLVLIAGN